MRRGCMIMGRWVLMCHQIGRQSNLFYYSIRVILHFTLLDPSQIYDKLLDR